MIRRAAIVVLALAAAASAAGCRTPTSGREVSTTVSVTPADLALGSELRPESLRATDLAHQGRLDEAMRVLEGVLAKYKALMGDAEYVCLADAREEAVLREAGGPRSDAVRIDSGYCQAIHTAAFVLVARGDFANGLELLDMEIATAPFAAGAHAERGFALNQLGRSDDALLAYQRSLELAETYASQQPHQAAAHRGLGFTLIELGRLDEAESAYRRALELDPDSAVAKKELDYLQQLRRR
jgi:tetratricopeptide (TPR) repeat protein